MGWLQEQRDKKARAEALIQAVRDAFHAAAIPLDDEVRKTRLSNTQWTSLDKSNLENLLERCFLQPNQILRRRQVNFLFGIHSAGQYVYAQCWVPEVKSTFVDGAGQTYEEDSGAVRQPLLSSFLSSFNGQIEVRCRVHTQEQLPELIVKTSELVDQVVAFVGD